jgi:hypothetical protein
VVAIRTGAAPSEIIVSLADRQGAAGAWSARAWAINDAQTRWRVALPSSIKGAAELQLRADYREWATTPAGERYVRSGGVIPFRVPVRRRADVPGPSSSARRGPWRPSPIQALARRHQRNQLDGPFARVLLVRGHAREISMARGIAV